MALVITQILNKVWPYIAGASFLLISLFGAYKYIDHRGYQRAASEYELKITEIQKASAQAEALAWKQKNDVEEEYNDKAKQANSSYVTLSKQYDAAILRLSREQNSTSSPGSASTTSSPDPSINSNRSGGNPQLPLDYTALIIPEEDAQICGRNTARLQAVREWGLSISTAAPQPKASKN